jgi:hypothetical protein
MTKAFAVILMISGLVWPHRHVQEPALKQPANPSLERRADPTPLRRHYQEGEKLTYHMKGINQSWRYQIDAIGVVKKDSAGRYFEEYSWSNFSSSRAGDSLPAESATFRQVVSLDLGYPPSMPDLRPMILIVGPITDLLTFYADMQMAIRLGTLVHAGDHSYVKFGHPGSWADGAYVLTGEDSIDFDLTLKDIDQANRTATLVVRHVPPEKPLIKLPAPWMGAPVADTPNNWVQIEKPAEGKYVASIGKETYEVEIKVSLSDGKILSVKMDNPVEVSERECKDRELSSCGEPRRYQIRRQIEMNLDEK